ncbi:sigma-70 family RNA polymerase sigma factor [Lapillicoccus sp.]|uniref:sigma-70 family RNA polymerase sigma factor n=1 Tax=Lapillicoccus sp. TaxID=1909287 RepID=UPI0027CFCB92|nr:sigma-70 family RNA polymerase sigma factor [Actinomycetota bacterium]
MAVSGTPETHPSRERTDFLLADLASLTSATAGDLARRSEVEETIVLLNLALADSIASRYIGRGIDRDDLVQVARMGLVKAVQRYRCGLGDSFAGFAAPTISGEIKRHFRDAGWMVRPPRRLQELSAQTREAEASLEQRLHRPPTVEEVASTLGVAPTQVAEAHAAASSFHALSLDAPPVGGDNDTTGPGGVHETLSERGDDPYAAVEDGDWLARGIAQLTERERLVLRLRFVETLTQSEIAERIGVSQMQVSRILRATLRRARLVLESSMVRLA